MITGIYCLSYAHDIMIWITRSLDLHSDNIITTTKAVYESSNSNRFKLYNATKRDIDYRKYKECRNLEVKELRNARNVFERKLVDDVKNNPKSFYRYVRTKTKSKDRVGPLKDPAGNLIEDDNIMCPCWKTTIVLPWYYHGIPW